jgi:hypothetical protein
MRVWLALEPLSATRTEPARSLRATLLAGLAAMTGCIPVDPGGCLEDAECGGDLCTDVNTCASPEEAPRWRIVWTVGGAAVSLEEPEACAPIAELALQVRSDADQVGYRPVRCELGRFEFRALPLAFDRVRIAAFDEGGRRLAVAEVRGDRALPEVVLDLAIGDP